MHAADQELIIPVAKYVVVIEYYLKDYQIVVVDQEFTTPVLKCVADLEFHQRVFLIGVVDTGRIIILRKYVALITCKKEDWTKRVVERELTIHIRTNVVTLDI